MINRVEKLKDKKNIINGVSSMFGSMVMFAFQNIFHAEMY
jgi:hypothetical protein